MELPPFIDEYSQRNSFKDLIKNLHYFYKIAHQKSAIIYTETPRFATHYNLYDNAKCDFSTPFKYLNGKNICIGDIIKVKRYLKNDLSDSFSKKGEETFIVRFDSLCEKGEDGCFLKGNDYSRTMSYLNDERYEKKDIEKICNIYEYKRELEKNWQYTQELNIDENLSKGIQMKETHSGKDADIFYDKNTSLLYRHTIDPDKLDETFKLYHNQINEFIGFCKRHTAESFINDHLGKEISKNISINLYDSGYGFGGAKIEKLSLYDFITLAMNKDITNQNELIAQIQKQNTQSFWEKFEKDLSSVSKDISNYEKNKAVLIPEAKERIPKEILAKIEKLNNDFLMIFNEAIFTRAVRISIKSKTLKPLKTLLNFTKHRLNKATQKQDKGQTMKKFLLAFIISLNLATHSLCAGIPTIDVGSLTQSILSYQETLQSNLHLLKQYQNQIEQMKEQGIGSSLNQILGENKAIIDKTLQNLDVKIDEDTFQETADISNVCAYLEQNSKSFKEAMNKAGKKLSNKVNACIITANTDGLYQSISELKNELNNLAYDEVEKRNEIEHKINMLNQAQSFLAQQANNQKSSKILTMYDLYLEGDSNNPYSKAKFDEDLKALATQLSQENNTKQATALTNTMLLKLLEVSQKQYELSLNLASMNANEKSQGNTSLNTQSYLQEKPKITKTEDLETVKAFKEEYSEAVYDEFGMPDISNLIKTDK